MTERNGKISDGLGIGRINTVKMTISSKANYGFIAIPIKIFHITIANNPNIYMEPQKTQNCQSN